MATNISLPLPVSAAVHGFRRAAHRDVPDCRGGEARRGGIGFVTIMPSVSLDTPLNVNELIVSPALAYIFSLFSCCKPLSEPIYVVVIVDVCCDIVVIVIYDCISACSDRSIHCRRREICYADAAIHDLKELWACFCDYALAAVWYESACCMEVIALRFPVFIVCLRIYAVLINQIVIIIKIAIIGTFKVFAEYVSYFIAFFCCPRYKACNIEACIELILEFLSEFILSSTLFRFFRIIFPLSSISGIPVNS